MTLSDLVYGIERVAAKQPAVKMIVRNDIFRLNAAPSVLYAVFGWLQREHAARVDSSFMEYSFTFFYVDRLTADRGNELEIQSEGVQVLDNIIRAVDELAQVATDWTFTTFNQRFADECAGVFTNVTFRVPLGSLCPDSWPDYNPDFNNDFLIY